jgi:hypothetical protein
MEWLPGASRARQPECDADCSDLYSLVRQICLPVKHLVTAAHERLFRVIPPNPARIFCIKRMLVLSHKWRPNQQVLVTLCVESWVGSFPASSCPPVSQKETNDADKLDGNLLTQGQAPGYRLIPYVFRHRVVRVSRPRLCRQRESDRLPRLGSTGRSGGGGAGAAHRAGRAERLPSPGERPERVRGARAQAERGGGREGGRPVQPGAGAARPRAPSAWEHGIT